MSAENSEEDFGQIDPKLDLTDYKYPPTALLSSPPSNLSITAQKLDAEKNSIIKTLAFSGVEIDRIKATIGPTIILYEVIPAPGVRIAKIKSLEPDLALALAAKVEVIGQLSGKGTVGIKVFHAMPDRVTIRSVINTEPFEKTKMELPIALGKTIDNSVFTIDLAELPHILIGGATGQGKSVCLNVILASLLYKKHPSELKLILIDVRQLELALYTRIERQFLAKLPHSRKSIVGDLDNAIHTLAGVGLELDQRYGLLKKAGARNIKEYNKRFVTRLLETDSGHRYLPYLVIVIDEFAELLNPNHDVETVINRLAQLGRPVGIHLVIATQRPSVKVITGNIKANFSCRLAFRVASTTDSKTILDIQGAESLHHPGDILFRHGADVFHLQGAIIDTHEIESLTNFVGLQPGYPTAMLLPESKSEDASTPYTDPGDRDPYFEEAARLIVMYQQGSPSLIQRKLKLGYNRAGRIMNQLESAGIVGAFDGSKAREVLFADETSLMRFLNGEPPYPEPTQPAPAPKPVNTVKAPEEIPVYINLNQPEPKVIQKSKSFWQRLFNS
ncbi:DNA translocase FtsK [Mucilaginibacter corticis]|uniref:DNA translocase FtsK n=1 Tax=Mucilaginibacter corticis TaxID=2597670 RepID=A0A556M4U9_9SPHI|nr:DNA translocase FtsK [Mucilaginibacter corticis]TSJ34922.1 DNA translocase FtsK [Mucilaginibacter corticis]